MASYLETPNSLSSEECRDDHHSLQSLVEAFGSVDSAPSLQQIYDWLEKVETSREELQPYLGFKEGNYWRHRVYRNKFVEMLVLCWRPGQRTPIHDHNGSHGGVKICEGLLWETVFTYDAEAGLEYKTARELPSGSVTGSDIPDIHQLGNPDVSGQDLITLHVYAPPLGVLHTYKPGSAKIDLYVPDESDAA
ncbi:MAG TPA: cysteine dioxygenase family protein [Pyrinomonadaceae bacterium]|nr:cysteine dioxygenase family protein [Pyrinomonadaceae bacterium]